MTDFDAVVVGAGFAGMYMLVRLRRLGMSALVVEAGGDVGGTWYWNRYPGCRCDIESLSYSYGFDEELQQSWRWPERYAAQPDILRYARHVADRFELRRDIRFTTRVTAAHFDEAQTTWQITTDAGDRLSARFCIMATGALSVPNVPKVPGLEDYTGRVLHTADWPEDGVDLAGDRVGVIGTGSSGIQTITAIAPVVGHLTVFQRTPHYSVPAFNGPLSDAEDASVKAQYRELRRKARYSITGDFPEAKMFSVLECTPEQREEWFEQQWRKGGFNFQYAMQDLLTSQEANDIAAEFVRRKIRERVKDPRVAEMLCPRTYPLGAKRLCIDTGYYETFNRDNVSLVDIRSHPITGFSGRTLHTDSSSHDLDTLILATGYDAVTGALNAIDIRGTAGATLKDKWADGPVAYLGLMVAGFPNLFTVTGPGSPSVFTNVLMAGEQHVEFISDCLEYMRAHGLGRVEADPRAEADWTDLVAELASKTLYPKADSWYMGANIPGKPRVFMAYIDGVKPYVEECDRIVAEGYRGFRMSPAAHTAGS